jgi:DNA invertase Pin-like site-specific DNA recombinase
MRKAYSYQRFSSIKQKDGDSTKRQTDAAGNFCNQFGLSRTVADKLGADYRK